MTIKVLSCAAAFIFASTAAAFAHDSEDDKVTVVYDRPLPNVPGKSSKGVLVEYLPGGSSPAHTHAKSAFIYATVLEGAITNQVISGPVIEYHAGDNFTSFRGSPCSERKCKQDRAGTASCRYWLLTVTLQVFLLQSGPPNEDDLDFCCRTHRISQRCPLTRVSSQSHQ